MTRVCLCLAATAIFGRCEAALAQVSVSVSGTDNAGIGVANGPIQIGPTPDQVERSVTRVMKPMRSELETIKRYLRLGLRPQGTGGNNVDDVDDLLKKAEASRNAGRMEVAESLLGRASSKAIDRADCAAKEAAEVLRRRSALALVRSNWRQAATLLQDAFDITARGVTPESLGWLMDAGDALLAGDEPADALEIYLRSRDVAQAHRNSKSTKAEWQYQLSAAYQKVGDAQMSLQNASAALRSFTDALPIAQELTEVDPKNPSWRHNLSACYRRIGQAHGRLGDLRRASTYYSKALDLNRVIAGRQADCLRCQEETAEALERIGDVQSVRGQLVGAIDTYRSALEIRKRLAVKEPKETERQEAVAAIHDRLGDAKSLQGDLAGAFDSYQDSLRIREGLASQDPGNLEWQRERSAALERIADVLRLQGDNPKALGIYETALSITKVLLIKAPNDRRLQRDLSFKELKLSGVQVAQGDFSGALRGCRGALEVLTNLAEESPNSTLRQRDLSLGLEGLAGVQQASGDFIGAARTSTRAVGIRTSIARAEPENTLFLQELSLGYGQAAGILQANQDLAGARRNYSDSVTIRKKLVAGDPENLLWTQYLAVDNINLGEVEHRRGEPAEALGNYETSFSLLRDLAARSPDSADVQLGLSFSAERIGTLGKRASKEQETSLKLSLDKLARLEEQGRLPPGKASFARALMKRFDGQLPQSQSLLQQPVPGSTSESDPHSSASLVSEEQEFRYRVGFKVRNTIVPRSIPTARKEITRQAQHLNASKGLGFAVTGESGCTIAYHNEVRTAFRLIKAVFILDGITIVDGVGGGGSGIREPIDAYDGPLQPGTHTVLIRLVYEGSGLGTRSDLEGYRFRVRFAADFTTALDRVTEVRVVGYEKDPRFENRSELDYKLTLVPPEGATAPGKQASSELSGAYGVPPSGGDLLKRGRTHRGNVEAALAEVMRTAEEARNRKDVKALNCVREEEIWLRWYVDRADETLDRLQESVDKKGDGSVTICDQLNELDQNVQRLRKESRGCWEHP